VTRRRPLPGAAELFRSTLASAPVTPARAHPVTGASHPVTASPAAGYRAPAPRAGSGRQKHDTKITVYVCGEELVALEQARLVLRALHGLSVDRGRIVREAIAVLLADLDEHGENSMLVRRLRGSSA
jgi:hypothetical protein